MCFWPSVLCTKGFLAGLVLHWRYSRRALECYSQAFGIAWLLVGCRLQSQTPHMNATVHKYMQAWDPLPRQSLLCPHARTAQKHITRPASLGPGRAQHTLLVEPSTARNCHSEYTPQWQSDAQRSAIALCWVAVGQSLHANFP